MGNKKTKKRKLYSRIIINIFLSVVMTFDFSRIKSNDAKVESRIRQKHRKSNEIRLFRLFHIQRKKKLINGQNNLKSIIEDKNSNWS
jgi:hypothetical protein